MSYVDEIKKIVEGISDTVISTSDSLWGYSELYFEEYNSSKLMAAVAKENGFTVDLGVCDMPTAFIAKWGTGKIKVGFLAEYDALPSLCQEAGAVTRKAPEGKEQTDSGQGCGHNCLGAGALGAAIALKKYCEVHSLDVQIVLFGCPAEENGSGKMFLAREGAFDDIDLCIGWHPHTFNEVAGESSLACLSAKFVFHGVSSHAAAVPHLGRSALDACELMNVGVNYLREHIISEARVHYSYLEVGGKAPNTVQDLASTYYFIRAPKVKQALDIAERVYDIAKGAALMTGTTVDIHRLDGLCDFVPNKTLGDAACKVFKEIGAPEWSNDDLALAGEYAKTFEKDEIAIELEKLCKNNNIESQDQLKTTVLDSFVAPYKHAPEKVSFGSTDVGDVSYCTPTVQLHVATCAIGTPGHSWQRTGQGKTSIAYKGTLTAAAVMAATALKLVLEPETLDRAKAEHKKNVPQGYTCPAPKGLKPTIS